MGFGAVAKPHLARYLEDSLIGKWVNFERTEFLEEQPEQQV